MSHHRLVNFNLQTPGNTHSQVRVGPGKVVELTVNDFFLLWTRNSLHMFHRIVDQMLRSFQKPEPVREVSLATHRSFIKKRLIDVLKKEILNALPRDILHRDQERRVLEIRNHV